MCLTYAPLVNAGVQVKHFCSFTEIFCLQVYVCTAGTSRLICNEPSIILILFLLSFAFIHYQKKTKTQLSITSTNENQI